MKKLLRIVGLLLGLALTVGFGLCGVAWLAFAVELDPLQIAMAGVIALVFLVVAFRIGRSVVRSIRGAPPPG